MIVGTVINNRPPGPSQRSATEPGPIGHIEMNRGTNEVKGAFINPSKDRLQQELREREQQDRKNAKEYEELRRKKYLEQEEAQRQREAAAARKINEQNQERATKRANRESQVRAAIFAQGGIVQVTDSNACQVVFTNATAYWAIIQFRYTVKVNGDVRPFSLTDVLPPGQTRTYLVWTVICGKDNWSISGFTWIKKDHANNYYDLP